MCVCVFLQMAPIGYALFTMSNVLNAIGSSLTLRLQYVIYYICSHLSRLAVTGSGNVVSALD